jgi:hypothetical protein
VARYNAHNTDDQKGEALHRLRQFSTSIGIDHNPSAYTEAFYALNGYPREAKDVVPAEYRYLELEDIYDLTLLSPVPLTVTADDMDRLTTFRADREARINTLVKDYANLAEGPKEKDLQAFQLAVQRSEASESKDNSGNVTFKPLLGEVGYIRHVWEGHLPVTDYLTQTDNSGSMEKPGSVISLPKRHAVHVQQLHPGQKFHEQGGVCIAPVRRREEEFASTLIHFEFVSALVGSRLAGEADFDSKGELTAAARDAGKLAFYVPPINRPESMRYANFRIDDDGAYHIIDLVPIRSVEDLVNLYRPKLTQDTGGATALISMARAFENRKSTVKAFYPNARFMYTVKSDGAECGIRPGTQSARYQRHEVIDALLPIILSGQQVQFHPITQEENGVNLDYEPDLGSAMRTMYKELRKEQALVQKQKNALCNVGLDGFGMAVGARLEDNAGWMSVVDGFTPKGMADSNDDAFSEALEAALKAIMKLPLTTRSDCEKADKLFKQWQVISKEANRLTELGANKLEVKTERQKGTSTNKSKISTSSIGKDWFKNMQALRALINAIDPEHALASSSTFGAVGRTATLLGRMTITRKTDKPKVDSLGMGFQLSKSVVVTPTFDGADDIHPEDLLPQISAWDRATGSRSVPVTKDQPPAYSA